MYTIMVVDMHIRDERVLEYIKARAKCDGVRLIHDDIASEFKCCRKTVVAITQRLKAAGLITVDDTAKRGGYIYSIPTCPVLR